MSTVATPSAPATTPLAEPVVNDMEALKHIGLGGPRSLCGYRHRRCYGPYRADARVCAECERIARATGLIR